VHRRKIAIITSGYLPVPNVLGGAVEALDMMLVNKNEEENLFDFTVFSSYTPEAQQAASTFHHTEFEFIKTLPLTKFIDQSIFWVAKNILRKTHLMSYRFIAQRLAYIHSVSQRIHNDNFDAIIIENHASLFMILKRFGNAKKYQGKVYYHLHNEVKNTYGCTNEILMSKKVLGVSRFIVDTLDSKLRSLGTQGLQNSQKSVWRNCVDTSLFNPANLEVQQSGKTLRIKLGIPEENIVFLFSGRLTPEKGAIQLLKAFSAAKIPNATLVIVGSFFFNSDIASPFEKELHTLAREGGDRIKFTGFIKYDEMPVVYSMADICCLPSIWDDPAPLAVIESLASSKALITTKSGGIPEYASNRSAYILERDEYLTANITSAMQELAADASKRRVMGRFARQETEDLNPLEYLHQLASALETD
jgi:glycosyltransferase involved in cell wall biosynthesis